MSFAHHVRFRLVEVRVLAPSRRARLLVVRRLLHIGRDRLLVFGLADTHLHALVLGDRAEAMRFGRRVLQSLGPRLGHDVPFAPTWTKPMQHVWHLENCFGYILDQHEHHGLHADPLRESTSLHDLLGLRWLAPWLPALVREHLPRLRADELRARLPFDRTLAGHPDDLRTAAAATLAHAPDHPSRALTTPIRAAVHVGRRHWRPGEVAPALQLPDRTARRHAATPSDATFERAVSLQLALRAAHRSHPPDGPPPAGTRPDGRAPRTTPP